MELRGHRVLVTGGSAGIGLSLARAFLERGNQVAICGRNLARLEAARRELPSLETIQADVARDDDLRRLRDETLTRLGGLSVLVNNAGIQYQYRLWDTPPGDAVDRLDYEIAVNFAGLVKLTALLLPALRASPGAAIVNLSSVLAITPKGSAPVYSATKAAVHSFSRTLRHQLEATAPTIRVFDVMPSLVDTDMTRGRWRGELTPEDVAEKVLQAMAEDRSVIRLGRTRMVSWLHRLAPELVARRLLRS